MGNQKNAVGGESVSHFKSELAAAFPFKAGVKIFLCVQEQGCPSESLVSDYPKKHQRLFYISALDIILVLQNEAARFGVARLSFAPEVGGPDQV